jgi:PadR family transcriptional regulator, regulatory protein AphA
MQAILGLLTIEPMSGYDLRQTFLASVGHIWTESYGQIYPNLKRLAAGGMVRCKSEKRKGGAKRHIYSITPKGRARLTEWLESEPQPEIPRNEMLLKLFFGAQVLPPVLIGYLERMIRRHRELLEKFKRVEREDIPKNRHYPDAPFWQMTARYGQMEMEAHLRWAEETLNELRKMAKKQGSLEKAPREKRNAGE